MRIVGVEFVRQSADGVGVVDGADFVDELGWISQEAVVILEVGFSVHPDLVRGFPP